MKKEVEEFEQQSKNLNIENRGFARAVRWNFKRYKWCMWLYNRSMKFQCYYRRDEPGSSSNSKHVSKLVKKDIKKLPSTRANQS